MLFAISTKHKSDNSSKQARTGASKEIESDDSDSIGDPGSDLDIWIYIWIYIINCKQ